MISIQHYDIYGNDWNCFFESKSGELLVSSFDCDTPSWVAHVVGVCTRYGLGRDFIKAGQDGSLLNIGDVEDGYYEFRNIPLVVNGQRKVITGFFKIESLDRFLASGRFRVVRECKKADVYRGLQTKTQPAVKAPWYQAAMNLQAAPAPNWGKIVTATSASTTIITNVFSNKRWGVYEAEKGEDQLISYRKRVAPIYVGGTFVATDDASLDIIRAKRVVFCLKNECFYRILNLSNLSVNYLNTMRHEHDAGKTIFVTPDNKVVEVARSEMEKQLGGKDPYLVKAKHLMLSNKANYQKIKYRSQRSYRG